MRQDLDTLTLYRFRYKHESAADPLHTGVIAERAPARVLARDKKSVNLYDYVGLSLGATKAVSHEVARLTEENRALKQRLARLEGTLARLARAADGR